MEKLIISAVMPMFDKKLKTVCSAKGKYSFL